MELRKCPQCGAHHSLIRIEVMLTNTGPVIGALRRKLDPQTMDETRLERGSRKTAPTLLWMDEGLLAIFPDACTRDLVEAHEGYNWETAKS